MGEFELGRGKTAAGKGNLQFEHGCSPLVLALLPYPERESMSSEKCNEAKKFHERGAEAVLDDSDCRDQSAKMCRQPAGRFSRRNADQAVRNSAYAACQD
jgi:hypothetical protein